jgi:hypothetical protein
VEWRFIISRCESALARRLPLNIAPAAICLFIFSPSAALVFIIANTERLLLFGCRAPELYRYEWGSEQCPGDPNSFSNQTTNWRGNQCEELSASSLMLVNLHVVCSKFTLKDSPQEFQLEHCAVDNQCSLNFDFI